MLETQNEIIRRIEAFYGDLVDIYTEYAEEERKSFYYKWMREDIKAGGKDET